MPRIYGGGGLPQRPRAHGRQLRTLPSLGSLGDDTLGAQAPQSDAEWKAEMLRLSRAQLEAHKTWADGDRFQKWIAIAATVMIPVSAAIWRRFGVGRRKPSQP